MTAGEREEIMAGWRLSFHELLEKLSIPPSRVYNGDQTGLYYQKLPNRMYVNKDTKHTHAGVKQMKDKTRVTLMVCKTVDGSKLPPAVVGKPKKPMCFREARNGMPPNTLHQSKECLVQQADYCLVDKDGFVALPSQGPRR